MTFFRHVISGEGIMVDLQKVVVVKKWPRSVTLIDIQSFFGLADYYKRFTESFLTITAPLTKLTQKKVKFLWSDMCDNNY